MEKYFIKPHLYSNGVVVKLQGSRRISVINHPHPNEEDTVIISSTRPLDENEDINIPASETGNIKNKFRITNTFYNTDAAYCLYIALKMYFENNINKSIKTETIKS